MLRIEMPQQVVHPAASLPLCTLHPVSRGLALFRTRERDFNMREHYCKYFNRMGQPVG